MPLFSQGRFLILVEMETLRKRCTRSREAAKMPQIFAKLFFSIKISALFDRCNKPGGHSFQAEFEIYP
jgi:hypothetical protein